jgi:hypothetical protein
VPIQIASLKRPELDTAQAQAAEFRLAYAANLQLADIAASHGLYADALMALRLAIECFFKCVYKCAIEEAFNRKIWEEKNLNKGLKPPQAEAFVHDIRALLTVLDHLTNIQEHCGDDYKELRALPALPQGGDWTGDRYLPRQHDRARERFEKLAGSFRQLLQGKMSHLA